MAKITYLLGAGASANSIPVVGDMHHRIIEIVKELKSYTKHDNFKQFQPDRFESLPNNLKEVNSTLGEVISELEWLLSEAESYYSIDTLARKFYLTSEEDKYERLKKCLIFYFTLEQLIYFQSIPNNQNYFFNKNPIDKRYDSFISVIASKTKDGISLNNNIKILTWNYDLQFELSLKRFKNKEINDLKNKYQIFPPLYFREENIEHLHKIDAFSLIKLNGNAVFATSSRHKDEYFTVFDKYTNSVNSRDILLGQLLDEWKIFDFRDNSACRFFNFVWEGNDDFKGRIYEAYKAVIIEAEKIASETEILVVIGYSFPIFNRQLDNRLFSKMTNLKKVYIQDKTPDRIKSTMVNAFKILQEKIQINENTEVPKIDIFLEPYTDQFIIPYELNQD